jgi:hypothetical protein
MNGWLEFAGGEEADFDQGEEDGYCCYGDYDCAGGSVLEMYLSVEEGLLHFHARRMAALWNLRKHPAVTSILDVWVVGVAEHDAGQDEEDSRDDELDGPEGDEEAFTPHFL